MSIRPLEWWIARIRLLAIPFAVLQVSLTHDYPGADETIAWGLTAALAIGAVALYVAVQHGQPAVWLQSAAMAFDFTVIAAFTILFAFEPGTPTRQLLLFAIVVGAARFGLKGGLAVAVAVVPISAWFEQRRSHFFHVRYRSDFVTFQAGIGVLLALLVGWLYARVDEQRRWLSSVPPRRSSCATSSDDAQTCSTPRTAARGLSARRSTSTRRSVRSSASCAGSCPSSGWRSCSPKRASRA